MPICKANAAGLPGGSLRSSLQRSHFTPVLGRALGAKDRYRFAETETKAAHLKRGKYRFETSVLSYCLELPHGDFGLVGQILLYGVQCLSRDPT